MRTGKGLYAIHRDLLSCYPARPHPWSAPPSLAGGYAHLDRVRYVAPAVRNVENFCASVGQRPYCACGPTLLQDEQALREQLAQLEAQQERLQRMKQQQQRQKQQASAASNGVAPHGAAYHGSDGDGGGGGGGGLNGSANGLA